MTESKRSRKGWWICLVVGLLAIPGWAQAAELKEAVEQLAAQLAKSVPEGRILRVAVTDFPDLQGVTSDLGRYIAERLTTRLSAQPQKFRMIERRRLGLVLGELKFSMTDLVDPKKAKELGRMLGVEGLVVGSVSDLGNQVDVDARIIEIETNNILPGVTASLSKDQVVTKLITEGRTGPTVTLSVGRFVESSGTTTAAVPPGKGIHPVGREFFVGTGVGVGRVHLFNIEIVGGNVLRFNLDFNWDTPFGSPVDVSLDNPVDTTFLVDNLGRQHPLVQATGISSDRPIRVPPQSSKRFTLTFPFPPEMESFKYQAVLLMRKVDDDRQYRLHIRTEKTINLTDFR